MLHSSVWSLSPDWTQTTIDSVLGLRSPNVGFEINLVLPLDLNMMLSSFLMRNVILATHDVPRGDISSSYHLRLIVISDNWGMCLGSLMAQPCRQRR